MLYDMYISDSITSTLGIRLQNTKNGTKRRLQEKWPIEQTAPISVPYYAVPFRGGSSNQICIHELTRGDRSGDLS